MVVVVVEGNGRGERERERKRKRKRKRGRGRREEINGVVVWYEAACIHSSHLASHPFPIKAKGRH